MNEFSQVSASLNPLNRGKVSSRVVDDNINLPQSTLSTKSIDQAYEDVTNISPSTDGPETFGWNSDMTNERVNVYQNHTAKQMDILHDMFSEQPEYPNAIPCRSPNGQQITNMTDERMWFKDNVALVFLTGCIFTELDRTNMNIYLNMFNEMSNVAYLLNYHPILAYTDELAQAIEEKMEIGNGNYHMCLVTIVLAKDQSVLNNAPEPQYTASGIIQKYTEWPSISKFMNEVMARYGLVNKEFSFVHGDVESSNNQHNSRKLGVKGFEDRGLTPDIRRDIETGLDIDLIYSEQDPGKDEFFDIRTRDTHKHRMNKETFNPNRSRILKNGSISSRINKAERPGQYITNDSTVEPKKGVQLKMNQIKPPPDKEIIEYQIFDAPDTYQDGQNVSMWANKEDIPRFAQIDYQYGGGGNSSTSKRISTNNKVLHIQNSLYPGGLSQNMSQSRSFIPSSRWGEASRQFYYSD